jgi:clan AA aspartic protease (TIGR02281 family)
MDRTKLRYFGVFVLIVSALQALGVAQTSDGTKSPQSIFADRGLVTLGFWLKLPNEDAVHDGVWAIQQMDEGLRSESAARRNLRFEFESDRKTLDDLENQYLAADKQYDQSVVAGKNVNRSNPDVYNEWVNANNELLGKREDIAIQIDKEQRAIQDLRAREGQVEDSRARYISLVMDIGTRAESVAAAYAALGCDAELAGAIAQYNQTAQPPLRLGPTDGFSDDLKYIRQCVKEVVSGTVPVHKDLSGGLHVQAVLDGKMAEMMTWDTGADTVLLSAATAKELGLNTRGGEKIEAMVADGRTVEARRGVLKSIRVGAFTVWDVECVVLPEMPGGDRSEDLLGDTFQSHFLSRLDQRSGQIQLTPIDPSVTSGPVAGPITREKAGEADTNPDLARRATATARSTADGADAHGAIDGIVAGAPQSPKNEWASGEATGSITLTWDDPVIMSSVKLWDRLDGTDHVVSGQLVFDDGSVEPYGELPQDGSPLTIKFRPKYVRWMRVEILSVSPGTAHGGFAEIAAYR